MSKPEPTTIAASTPSTSGARPRLNGFSVVSLRSRRSMSAASRRMSSGAPSSSKVSPTRTTVSSSWRPMFWFRRCTASG